MKRVFNILLFTLILTHSFGQVAYIGGSYQSASSSGSGAPGLPSLSYTPSAGTDRVLFFTITVERDHSGAKGTNWANPNAVGGANPTVTFGGVNMIRLRTVNYYQYKGSKIQGNATMSVEMIIYGILEGSIPAGTNSFVISGLNAPGHSGDEASVSAMMFENVIGVNYLGSDGCENCNSLSMAGLDPLDGNNMIVSFLGIASDRDISAGAGNTLVGSAKRTNGSGAFLKFSEQDGIAKGAQYVSGTAAVQNPSFSFSGAANVMGAVTAGFRLVSNVVLPAELVSFSAQNYDEFNKVEWKTAAEINVESFQLYRSSDAKTWENVYSVASEGTVYAGFSYHYDDYANESAYYKLITEDIDGSREESEVLFVEKDKQLNAKIYPNPTAGHIAISSDANIRKIELFTISGKLITSTSAGASFVELRILQGVPAGKYVLRIHSDETVSYQLLVRL